MIIEEKYCGCIYIDLYGIETWEKSCKKHKRLFQMLKLGRKYNEVLLINVK
jgi:hypothetical protein